MENIAWNLESEYPSYHSAEYQADFLRVQEQLSFLKSQVPQALAEIKSAELVKQEPPNDCIEILQGILLKYQTGFILSHNLTSYLGFMLSVDSADDVANSKKSEIDALRSQLSQSVLPIESYLKVCPASVLERVLEHPELKSGRFHWAEARKTKDILLSDSEETLLESVANSGFRAWGELYSNLCGTLRCQIRYADRTEALGLAQASAMLRHVDPELRRVAWTGIQEAWTTHQETAAAILNSIAGWRLEVYKRRSHKKAVHFLDPALHESRIERATLDAMLTACYDNLSETRKAPQLMARLLGKSTLDPWDLLAQSPVCGDKKERNFAEALQLVQESFAQVDPRMGEFVRMMADRRWIEGRVLPNKRNGAYCGGFLKSQEPRVFMTFMGSNSDVSTLAHELGHAYHSWVLRGRPLAETSYPMTLAETASVFSEAVLQDSLVKKASTKAEKIECGWSDLERATSFLINIPARFEFEKNFYDKRAQRSLSANDFKQLTDEAWTKWYGPTLSHNEQMYWATKLHFSMTYTSFYNFPYTFGYLFSMSIYARRAELGNQFMKKYLDILGDTGVMRAEDLVQKHLGEDIRRPEFWQKSIDVTLQKIKDFERLAF